MIFSPPTVLLLLSLLFNMGMSEELFSSIHMFITLSKSALISGQHFWSLIKLNAFFSRQHIRCSMINANCKWVPNIIHFIFSQTLVPRIYYIETTIHSVCVFIYIQFAGVFQYFSSSYIFGLPSAVFIMISWNFH